MVPFLGKSNPEIYVGPIASGEHMAVESEATSHGATESQDTVLASILQSINLKRILIVYAGLIAVYIYAPVLSLIAFSFNAGGLTFPFTDFTLQWYVELFNNKALIQSIVRSLKLAVVVTVITTILATSTALAYRYDFRGQRALLFLLILGIITPGITYGIGASLFLTDLLGFSKGLWLALPVHVVWALPFSVIVLLAGFPPTLAENEKAARIMGADRVTTFREIILPQIAPTVLGAAVFAFTLSYNEATRSLLLVGSKTTMPIQVFSITSSKRVTPELLALGSFTTLFSTILLAVAGLIVFYGAKR